MYFYNHRIHHEAHKYLGIDITPPNVRFTKILTKYSTEYNNMLFIHNLCIQLSMDRKDLYSFFLNLRKTHGVEEIYELFNDDNYDINKLDINRLFRYIDKFTVLPT